MRLLCVAALALLLSGCGDTAPEVDAAMVTSAQRRWPATNAQELAAGRQLLTMRCTACHELRGPQRQDEAGWQKYVTLMAPNAKLNDAEKQALLRYLLVGRERLLTPAK